MTVVLAAVISVVGTIIIGVGGWFGAKAVRRATIRKMDAETRQTNALSAKTEAESWSLLNGGLSARVTALEQENSDLRERLSASEARAERAENEARACRTDLDDLRRTLIPPETPHV